MASSSSKTEPGTAVAGQSLLDPWLCAAMLLLLVNDHVLKHHYPGVITGKLSDVAGLAFFPAFLQALVEVFGRRAALRQSRRLLVATTLLTVAVFSAIKLLPAAGEAYRVALGALSYPLQLLQAGLRGSSLPHLGRAALARDWTDLLALPAVLLPLQLDARRRRRHAPVAPRATIAATLGAAALLLAPAARADVYASATAGLGALTADSAGGVQSSSSERAARARYAVSLTGVGPVAQLAYGGQWQKGKFGALVEVAWYRGHASGTTSGLAHVGAAVDPSLFVWFWGPMGEVHLNPSTSLGFAAGFSGSYNHFEGATVHALADPSPPWGNALGLKLWLAGDFDLDLGRSLRLGWRCPLSVAWSGFHDLSEGLLDDQRESVTAKSLQWLFVLRYR